MRWIRNALLVVGCAASLAGVSVARADVIDDWNTELLSTLRVMTGPGGPGAMARACAMVHVAEFDAINSIRRTNQPIVIMVDAPEGASRNVAAAKAAHDVLSTLVPSRKPIYDALLNGQLQTFASGPSKAGGMQVGKAVAAAVIAARANDGSADNTPYTFGTQVGDYQLTEPQTNTIALGCNWGRVRPWVLTSGNQFRPPTPGGIQGKANLLRSQYYADQLNEVQSLGEVNSSTRTTEQTEIAWFWANDGVGTYRPPGHLIEITQTICRDHHIGFADKSRLFALVSLGMADAGIAVWDRKYDTGFDVWRPATAIRNADLDNNPNTTVDPNWSPLLGYTPPFPAYPSGHAAFGAVHATILKNFFGTDNISFTIGTDQPYLSNSPTNRTLYRSFTSFSQAARENGLSRIYLGVHYRFDADASFALGTTIGEYISQRVALPLCPADFNSDGKVDATDMAMYTNAFFAATPNADLNKDGAVNSIDFYMYSNMYLNGCSHR